MGGQTNSVNEWIDKFSWMDRVGEWKNEWKDRWVDGWLNGWVEKSMDGWMTN